MAKKRTKPPFRADHVGSLLRPPELLEARDRNARGELSPEALREIEDKHIRNVVKLQEDAGLESITDGEYRRAIFHIDFLKHLEGVAVEGSIATKFHKKDGNVDFAPPRLVVTGKLRHGHAIQVRDFEFLKSVTGRTPKVTIPSPTMVHFRGGREAIDKTAYPDLEEFFEDLAECYRQEIAALGRAGCRYLQLDDTNLAYLCDPEQRKAAQARGDDPDALTHRYARLINAAIADKPEDMVICTHLCRGTFRSASQWLH